ncbi:MAG: hypothetical protein ACM3U2_11230 [Deltaproteobacteria bacterium]
MVFGLAARSAVAVEPTLRDISLRGLEVGGTTTLIVDGDDLGTAPRLLLPFAARQKLKPGGTDKRATFDVILATDVIPGYYQLRVMTEGGVSLPAVICVDHLTQRPLAPAIEQLPVALFGAIGGSTVAETTFAGKAGQNVCIEVEAQRLGSKLRPVVHLYNAKRRQLAWSWGNPALAGDARLQATLPADGNYIIALHDSEYGVPGPGYFRLQVGQWAFVDQVFPPVVNPGQPTPLELLGMPAPMRVDLPAVPVAGVVPLAWPGEGLWSGPRPFVTVSSHTEVVEQPPAAGPQELPLGKVGVSGRLLAPYEEDRYRVAVTPGTRLRLEVFAERYGSPLDVALVVRNEAGDAVARVEDGAGTTDPVLEYAVPDRVTVVLIGVVDALGRGGPRGVYRLTVDPQQSAAAKPEFRLSTSAQRIHLPVGGRCVIPVWLDRRGYSGGVELAAAGLPAGFKVDGGVIADGTDGTLVTIDRGQVPGEAALTTWRGRGADGTERPVWIAGNPLERLQPWLATEIALAPLAAQAAEFQVDWPGLVSDAGLVPAGKLALPVKLTRPAGDPVVRLTLMTSQPPLLVNGQPDPNRALRQEKPVELAANVSEGTVTLLLPPGLPAPFYDVTVQAELLKTDKRTVLATAYTPVRRLPVRMPVVVQLAGAPQVEAQLDPQKGATVMISGKIERREGLTGDVVLGVTGLPAAARADAVTVKADATDFAVNLVLPANFAPGEYKGLKLSATGTPDPKQPNLRVRSREVEFALIVKAAVAK